MMNRKTAIAGLGIMTLSLGACGGQDEAATPTAVLSEEGQNVATEASNSISTPAIFLRIDLSTSNPIAVPEYAQKIAQDTAALPVWDTLRDGSEISMSTFGSYNPEAAPTNATEIKAKISRQFPRDAAKKAVYEALGQIPNLIENGTIKLQPETNIVAEIDKLKHRLDCQAQPSTVVIITDGMEASGSYGDTLPTPARPAFEGCSLYMVGVTGVNAAHTEELIAHWGQFGSTYGFDTVNFRS